jgi:ATPase subunit of ABC transporter with duplicated ATPase domains
MTSHDREFMNRLVNKIVEIDGGELTTYTGNYDFYEQQRELARGAARGAVRAAAGDARQGEAFIERFKARASHAAQVQSRVKKLEKIEQGRAAARRRRSIEFDFPKPPRSGDDVVKLDHVEQNATASGRSTRTSTCSSAAASAGA